MADVHIVIVEVHFESLQGVYDARRLIIGMLNFKGFNVICSRVFVLVTECLAMLRRSILVVQVITFEFFVICSFKHYSTGRNVGRGKVAYSWISPDPVKAGPTLGGGVVVHLSISNTAYHFLLYPFSYLRLAHIPRYRS